MFHESPYSKAFSPAALNPKRKGSDLADDEKPSKKPKLDENHHFVPLDRKSDYAPVKASGPVLSSIMDPIQKPPLVHPSPDIGPTKSLNLTSNIMPSDRSRKNDVKETRPSLLKPSQSTAATTADVRGPASKKEKVVQSSSPLEESEEDLEVGLSLSAMLDSIPIPIKNSLKSRTEIEKKAVFAQHQLDLMEKLDQDLGLEKVQSANKTPSIVGPQPEMPLARSAKVDAIDFAAKSTPIQAVPRSSESKTDLAVSATKSGKESIPDEKRLKVVEYPLTLSTETRLEGDALRVERAVMSPSKVERLKSLANLTAANGIVAALETKCPMMEVMKVSQPKISKSAARALVTEKTQKQTKQVRIRRPRVWFC